MPKETIKAMGSCKVCEINLYPPDNKPVIMPCGVKGCPYETPEEQAKNDSFNILTDAFNSGGSNYDVD